jgi:hypothetical protein
LLVNVSSKELPKKYQGPENRHVYFTEFYFVFASKLLFLQI